MFIILLILNKNWTDVNSCLELYVGREKDETLEIIFIRPEGDSLTLKNVKKTLVVA